MFTLEQRVGRLVEVRYRNTLILDELTQLMAMVRMVVSGAEVPLVFVSDARYVSAFPAEVADSLVWAMRRHNPKIAANGILLSRENIVFQRQAECMLLQAGNPARRTFFEGKDVVSWLGPHLDRKENERLGEFLFGPSARAADEQFQKAAK